MGTRHLRLKFWRWAHDRAEALWHWIYYHKLPDGKAELAKAAAVKNRAYFYSVAFVDSKGKPVIPPSPTE